MTNEEEIKTAINIMKQKYGIEGLNGLYMIATDIDGDERIAAMGIPDKLLWDNGLINANSFVKIKDLQGD